MQLGSFGPNEWLVDELYQQYLADKDSVDPAWWEFFEDYAPGDSAAPLITSIAAPATPVETSESAVVPPAPTPVSAPKPAAAAPAPAAAKPAAPPAKPAAPPAPTHGVS